MDDYASLASLAALYQEQSLIFNTSYEDIFDSFYIASSAGLFPEEKRIDEDALRAFLQSTREMIDGQQITAQTNEYVMASGNGQSVAQSEFAMSLIKVAEELPLRYRRCKQPFRRAEAVLELPRRCHPATARQRL